MNNLITGALLLVLLIAIIPLASASATHHGFEKVITITDSEGKQHTSLLFNIPYSRFQNHATCKVQGVDAYNIIFVSPHNPDEYERRAYQGGEYQSILVLPDGYHTSLISDECIMEEVSQSFGC